MNKIFRHKLVKEYKETYKTKTKEFLDAKKEYRVLFDKNEELTQKLNTDTEEKERFLTRSQIHNKRYVETKQVRDVLASKLNSLKNNADYNRFVELSRQIENKKLEYKYAKVQKEVNTESQEIDKLEKELKKISGYETFVKHGDLEVQIDNKNAEIDALNKAIKFNKETLHELTTNINDMVKLQKETLSAMKKLKKQILDMFKELKEMKERLYKVSKHKVIAEDQELFF